MIVCIKHPTYDGSTTPVLHCRTCCDNYLRFIRSVQEVMVGNLDWETSRKLVIERRNGKLQATVEDK